MTQQQLDLKLKMYRLTNEEYYLIQKLLGRDPLPIEWPLFSALWSEHCSYKSSKNHLKKFGYRNEMTPDMDGENAGIVDLGYDEKIAFKMESHNHPSYIEPVQGSATGVGGILRDIFTMGARPIMSANYLCFGEVESFKMKYLMNGVAKGISSYGNCVGVPTVTGQTNLHSRYNKNILVNALSVGYLGPNQNIALSKAKGAGNFIIYVGAKTGRDGVHGASMASEAFDEDSESKRPNVQIGDPFFEKLLIEACLDVLNKDLVVAMQDMGAAGLTSSSFEMASRGQVGLVLDLKKVPLRDLSMSAEDILLSESQERMLLICEPSKLLKLQNEFKKWSLDAVVLGEVQNERKVKLMWGGEVLTEIDPDLIIEQAPRYSRIYKKWNYPNRVLFLEDKCINLEKIISKKLKTFRLNNFYWIHNQYDQRVGARTAKACESSVAFVQLDHSKRALGLVVGCRPEVMLMDAEIGALDAVYYPAFQLALKGAKPLAVTDCLNFGNPQKEEIMTEFVASVEAIALASKSLDAPVISGNVSFYNETLGENIISTPATGVIGLRKDVDDILPDHFNQEFESIILVQLNWVESWTYVDQSENKISKFKYNENIDVAGYILKCIGLHEYLKNNNKKISAIKAIGLGGVASACLKMSQKDIGFDLSFDLSLKNDSNLLKDIFYGFILSTSEESIEFCKLLNSYFSDFQPEIFKIGETKKEKLILSKSVDLNFHDFQNRYYKNIEAEINEF